MCKTRLRNHEPPLAAGKVESSVNVLFLQGTPKPSPSGFGTLKLNQLVCVRSPDLPRLGDQAHAHQLDAPTNWVCQSRPPLADQRPGSDLRKGCRLPLDGVTDHRVVTRHYPREGDAHHQPLQPIVSQPCAEAWPPDAPEPSSSPAVWRPSPAISPRTLPSHPAKVAPTRSAPALPPEKDAPSRRTHR